MFEINTRNSKPIFCTLLLAGFLGLSVLKCQNLQWGSGFASIVWILANLFLACEFDSKWEKVIGGLVFCGGYLVRFSAALNPLWLYLLIFPLTALLIYGVFLLYARIFNRWNHILTTLAFPSIWIVLYYLAERVRVPALIRVDVLFTDMRVLLQAERVIGPVGLSFAVLWMLSLLHYALRKDSRSAGILGTGIFCAVMLFGIVTLYPNTTYPDSVRVAYTTGAYVGDYLTSSGLSEKAYIANMENAVHQAAEGGADILLFSEEAFEISAADERHFLSRCCAAAQASGIHMLVGLDIDNSTEDKTEKSFNKVVMIDNRGEILGSYLKKKLVPVLEDAYQAGEGAVPSHTLIIDGKELKVAYVICYDSNFPEYVSRMNDETDILLLPSWDWNAVTELHEKICCTLAVQNRVSVVKCTYDGISVAVNPDGRIIHSTDTAVVGFGKVQFADVPFDGGQGIITEEYTMENYVYGITAVETLSVLLCLLLLYGSLYENRGKSARNRIYTLMVLTCMLALIADAISWVLDGHVRLTSLLCVCTTLSMIYTYILSGEYIVYITAYVQERRKLVSVFRNVCVAVSALAVVFTVIISANGKLFYYKNGVYADGPWYEAYLLVNIATVALCLIGFISYGRSLSSHDIIATSLYIIIPSVAALINVFCPQFTYAYPAITLSLAVIYVMIQTERVVELKKVGQLSSHMALHDELTGLLNRRAYDERLQALSVCEEMVGVIFADVNGLKYANDHFGHKAGDRLLVGAAELLLRFFRKEEVFRISGDEFVVIMKGVPKTFFEQRTAKFARNLEKDGKLIACIGTGYGSGQDTADLLREAEIRMYENKERYHKEHPETRRT